jgi:hypothetical protein
VWSSLDILYFNLMIKTGGKAFQETAGERGN